MSAPAEDPRFACRRLGHDPQVKLSEVSWTWPGPLSYSTTCLRCGQWVEIQLPPSAAPS